MVTGNEEILWSYLLDPCFQLINTAGKPLTNGYIEVYYAGTRNKYYCASDFSGTLHPFKIPIDSLGSNIVLADPAFRYDIYIYNQFGSLQMSRYNVSPSSPGDSEGSTNPNADHWIGTYGSSQNIPGDNATIEVMPLPSSPDYQGSFIDRTVGNIMYLKPGTYLVDCIIRYRQNPEDVRNIYGDVLVYTGTENGLESGSWVRDETGVDANDDLNHFIRVSFIRDVTEDKHNDSLYFRPQTPVNWQYAYIKKLSIVKLGSGASIGGRYQGGDYISIEGNTISVTGINPDEYLTSGDLEGYATQEWVNEQNYLTSGDLNGYATESFVENYSSGFLTSADLDGYATQNWVQNQNYLTSADLEGYATESWVTGQGYATQNWVQNQNYLTSGDLDDYATKQFVQNGLSTKLDSSAYTEPVQSDWTESDSADLSYIKNKPIETDLYAGDNIQIVETSSGYVISASGDFLTSADLVGYATEQYVEDYTSGFVTSADIPSLEGYATESWVENYSSGFITSADVPSIQGYATEAFVTGYVDNATSAFITSADLPDLSDYATTQYVNDGLDTKLDSSAYTAPVQSDWSQTNSGALDYIKNKPDVMDLAVSGVYAGQYISITDTSSGVVIAATGLQPSGSYLTPSDLNGYATEQYVDDATSAFITSADVPSLAGYATETYVQNYTSGFITSGDLPDLSDYATKDYVDSEVSGKADKSEIPSLEGYATEQYVENATSAFITSADVPSLAGYATQNWVEDYTSAFITSADVPSLAGYATETYVQNYTSGFISETEVQTLIDQSTSGFITSADLPSLDGYATENWVTGYLSDNYPTSNDVDTWIRSSIEDFDDYVVKPGLNAKLDTSAYVAPVQSDWSQTTSGALDYIKNKPAKSNLLAGTNITIAASGNDFVISSTGGGGGGGSSYSAGQYISIANDTISVTGLAPQVQADWTQSASGNLDYIKNKPVTLPLIAGDGISITVTASGIVISATGGGGSTGGLDLKFGPMSGTGTIALYNFYSGGSTVTWSSGKVLVQSGGTESTMTSGELAFFNSSTDTYNGVWLGSGGYIVLHTDDTSVLVSGYGAISSSKSQSCTFSGNISVSLKKDGTEIGTNSTTSFDYSGINVHYNNT